MEMNQGEWAASVELMMIVICFSVFGEKVKDGCEGGGGREGGREVGRWGMKKCFFWGGGGG